MFSFLLGIFLVEKLLGHIVTLGLTFRRTARLLSEICVFKSSEYASVNMHAWALVFVHMC